jgi:hypothetical protein
VSESWLGQDIPGTARKKDLRGLFREKQRQGQSCYWEQARYKVVQLRGNEQSTLAFEEFSELDFY